MQHRFFFFTLLNFFVKKKKKKLRGNYITSTLNYQLAGTMSHRSTCKSYTHSSQKKHNCTNSTEGSGKVGVSDVLNNGSLLPSSNTVNNKWTVRAAPAEAERGGQRGQRPQERHWGNIGKIDEEGERDVLTTDNVAVNRSCE